MRNFSYWYLNNLYSPSEIQDIANFSETNHNPSWFDNPARDVVKTTGVKIVEWHLIKSRIEKLYQSAKFINTTEIGYDLFDMTDLQSVNINTYDSKNNGEYGWHIDATADESPVDIKLTVVMNISTEPFEGGEFEIFRQGSFRVPEIEKPGNAIVFPSFYNHRVLPVTKGIRKTLSFWIYGSKFR